MISRKPSFLTSSNVAGVLQAGLTKKTRKQSTGQKTRTNAFRTTIIGFPATLKASWSAPHARIRRLDTLIPLLRFIITVTIQSITGYYGASWYEFQDNQVCAWFSWTIMYISSIIQRKEIYLSRFSIHWRSKVITTTKLGKIYTKMYGIWAPALRAYSTRRSNFGNFDLKFWEHALIIHSEAWACSVFFFFLDFDDILLTFRLYCAWNKLPKIWLSGSISFECWEIWPEFFGGWAHREYRGFYGACIYT